MKIDLTTVAILGVVGYFAYRLSQADVPSVTEGANRAFWHTSFGDLATLGLGAYGNTWQWRPDPFSEEEAERAAEVAENLNNELGYNSGMLGTL